MQDGAGAPHVGIVLVQFQCLRNVGFSLQGVLLLHPHLGTHQIGGHVAWGEGEQLLHVGTCTVIVLLAHLAQDEVVPDAHILRSVHQCLIIVADGILKPSLIDACKAAELVVIHHEGVSSDGLRAVLFGSLIVLQVQFGKSAEEVRGVQIGLGINHLVEILDGEHVVLKIECIASYHHHPVGVDLSCCTHGEHHQQEYKEGPEFLHLRFYRGD